MDFASCRCVFWLLSRYSRLPPTCIHISLTGVSKLAIGVNASLNSCLFLFLSPGMDWSPMSIAEIDSRLPERA